MLYFIVKVHKHSTKNIACRTEHLAKDKLQTTEYLLETAGFFAVKHMHTPNSKFELLVLLALF